MREPKAEGGGGGGHGVLGAGAALLAGLGAMVAKFGDDIGHFVGTGARMADEVSVGAHGLSSAEDLSHVGRVGSGIASDGALGVAALAHEGAVSDDVAHVLDALSHGVDAAGIAVDVVGSGADAADDRGLSLVKALDPSASTGAPELTFSAPAEASGPALVLVLPDVPVERAVADCVTSGHWCVAESAGGEPFAEVKSRFDALSAWYLEAHPSDAAWVAAYAAKLPPGVHAAWLAAGEAGPVLRRSADR